MSIFQLNLFPLIQVVLFLMTLEVIEMWYLIVSFTFLCIIDKIIKKYQQRQ